MSTEHFQFDAVFHIEDDVDLVASGQTKNKFAPEEVESIRRAAFAEGEASAVAKASDAAAQAAARIRGQLETIAAGLNAEILKIEREATQLALAIGEKMADAALKRWPEEALRAPIEKCVSDLRRLSHLEIKTSPEICELATKALEPELSSLSGKLEIQIQPDRSVPLADCRIVWAQGELARDHAALKAEIEQAMEDFFASREIELANATGSPSGEAATMETSDE